MHWLSDVWRWLVAPFKGKGRIKHQSAVLGVRLEPSDDIGDLDSGQTKRVRVVVMTEDGDRPPKSVTNLTTSDPRAAAVFEAPETVAVTAATLTGDVDALFDFEGDAT
jgi:hypothetical protein